MKVAKIYPPDSTAFGVFSLLQMGKMGEDMLKYGYPIMFLEKMPQGTLRRTGEHVLPMHYDPEECGELRESLCDMNVGKTFKVELAEMTEEEISLLSADCQTFWEMWG